MLSDGQLSPGRGPSRTSCRTLLNVKPETASRIIDVLGIKNAG